MSLRAVVVWRRMMARAQVRKMTTVKKMVDELVCMVMRGERVVAECWRLQVRGWGGSGNDSPRW
eukprot:9500928-Pyramimonas_sp.AAC.4